MKTGRNTLTIALLLAFLPGFLLVKTVLAQQLAPILTDEQDKAVAQKYHAPDYAGTPRTPATSTSPVASPSGSAPGNGVTTNSQGEMILQGGVTTLDAAMRKEKGKVDWYSWYLATRQIIGHSGGIQCATGTPIQFNKDGHVNALSFDARCQMSVIPLYCPLPPGTSFPTVVLPARPGHLPPASPEELYDMIKQSDAPAW